MIVVRTDVPVLDYVAILLVQPAQRKTLRSTDIRTRLIDSAASGVVQEGARSLSVWFGTCEPTACLSPDPVGFDLEYRQPVDAAVRAPQSTRDSFAEPAGNHGDLAIHVGVQVLDRLIDLEDSHALVRGPVVAVVRHVATIRGRRTSRER